MLTRNTLKRAIIVALGVGAGPLLQLLATPILARLYTPAEFGHLAVFLSAASLLITISCLRYEAAIAVVEDELVNATAWVALFGALFLLIVMLFLVGTGLPQTIFPAVATLGSTTWGVPLAGASGGVILVGSYLTLRRGEFFRNAAIRSSQTILFVGVAIGTSGIGLVRANILSALVVGTVVLAYLAFATLPVSLKKLRPLANRFRQYPLLLTTTSLLDAAALSMPVFFISTAYGLGATGHYSQIQRLVGAPMILSGVVVGQLFLKRSGELFRTGLSSGRLMWKCVGALSLEAFIMLAAILLAGEPLFRLLLGDAWRVDVPFLLLVCVPLIFRSVVSPVSTIFLTHNKVHQGARWQGAYFVTSVCVLYVSSKTLTFDNFLIAYAIHEAILYSVYLAMANGVASGTMKHHEEILVVNL